MQRTYLALVAFGLLVGSISALSDQTGARLDPDCACQTGFEVNCTDKYPMLRAWELITKYKCNETGSDGIHPKCAINKSCSLWFYVLNAYRYGCPPTVFYQANEIAANLPFYQASSAGFTCYNCFQPRYYSSTLQPCPKWDCANTAAMVSAWSTLKTNCTGTAENTCASESCRTSYAYLKSNLDACAPTSIPTDILYGMPYYDGICWGYGKCNFYNASLTVPVYDLNCTTKYNMDIYSYLSNTPSQFNITGNSATRAMGMGALVAVLLVALQMLLY